MCFILTTMSNNYGNYHRGRSLWWGEEEIFNGETLNIKTTSNFLFVTKLREFIFYTEMQSTINYPYNHNRSSRGICRNSLLQTDRKIVWKQFENNIEHEYDNKTLFDKIYHDIWRCYMYSHFYTYPCNIMVEEIGNLAMVIRNIVLYAIL